MYKLLSMVFMAVVACEAKHKRHTHNQASPIVHSGIYAAESLRDHSHVFDKRIVQVAPGSEPRIFVAIGYALANMIMIEGTNGIIIIDTTESSESATEIMKEFRKLTTKPCKGIVITHFHKDHYSGVSATVEACSESSADQPLIIAHSSTVAEIRNFVKSGVINFKRAQRQFGRFLTPNTERINNGIGLELKSSLDEAVKIVVPTLTFDDTLTLDIAGEELQLFHTPGETRDHITAWLPEKRVVFPGDNIYRAFPAVYTLRGTPFRDTKLWCKSIDMMRDLKPLSMVPSHTGPVSGPEVDEILTVYRDALQYVHDQTIRWMNKGNTSDEIAEVVKLPKSLANHEYLQEFYGSVAWTVKSVYQGYLGWFDGNAAHIRPMSAGKKIQRWQKLLGGNGYDIMLNDVEISWEKSLRRFTNRGIHKVKELQWCLEVTLAVLKAPNAGEGVLQRASSLSANCMRAMANETNNAQARNYYLTYAKELDSDLVIQLSSERWVNIMMEGSLDYIFDYFQSQIVAENCNSSNPLSVAFQFSDLNEIYVVQVRNCVMQTVKHIGSELSDPVNCQLELRSRLWRRILAKQKSFGMAFAAGRIRVTGDILAVKTLMELIDESTV